MKIITLNTWGGRAGEELLLSFFEAHRDSVDVFCLQEVWRAPHTGLDGQYAGGVPIDHKNIMTEGLQDISKILSGHDGYFRSHFGNNYGLAIFVRKGMKVMAEGEIYVHKDRDYVPDGDIGNHARNIQYLTLMLDEQPVTVINFHGLWNGKGKTDSEDRLKQSENIIKFIDSLNTECVFCGDFNLLPDTRSMKIFEESGLINLIKENNIKSTRTSFYTKPEKHADYVLVSKGIKVKDFKVLLDEVSDHSPLYLEI